MTWFQIPSLCSISSLDRFFKTGFFKTGVPKLPDWTDRSPRPVRNRAAQQEVSGGQEREASSAAPHRSPSLALLPEPYPPALHHPHTPAPSVEKLSSTKLAPGAKKVGDCCFKINCPELNVRFKM